MMGYIEHILFMAGEQERLLLAAEGLCREEARASRALRLCLSGLLLLLLTAIPTECGAMLF